MSILVVQSAGGLTCLAATVVAAAVARARFASGRTHFISEVLALAWWQRERGERHAGFWGSLLTSMLFAAGGLGFTVAAALTLSAGWSLAAACAVVTGGLLLGVVAVPLQPIADCELPVARGAALLHPLLAAGFYLAAMVTSAVTVVDHAGPLGTTLAGLHLVSSAALVGSALWLSPQALGVDAYRPWYLPGVRILLDRRPHSPAEWIRRLQWPATLLVGLDLGLTPTGI